MGVISKATPNIRHGYIEAILCLSGEHQKLYLIQILQNTHADNFWGGKIVIWGAITKVSCELQRNRSCMKTW